MFAIGIDKTPPPKKLKIYLTNNPARIGDPTPTTFIYDLPEPSTITLKIYDVMGDLVRTIVEDLKRSPGRDSQVWDGMDDFGEYVGSGIYIYRFEVKTESGKTKTIIRPIGVIK